MDPNRKEKLDMYEQNAKKMYYVGFALMPLAWLMCWIYSTRRMKESEFLTQLAHKSFILWWVGVFVIGAWTMLYDAFWEEMAAIGYSLPLGGK